MVCLLMHHHLQKTTKNCISTQSAWFHPEAKSTSLNIKVLHRRHVAWQDQYIIFPMGKNCLSFAKYFYCSCHANLYRARQGIKWILLLGKDLFIPTCSMGSDQASCLSLNHWKSKLRLSQGKQYMRYFSYGQGGIHVFSNHDEVSTFTMI